MMYLLSRNGSTARYDESSGAYKDGKSTTESRIREKKEKKRRERFHHICTFVHSYQRRPLKGFTSEKSVNTHSPSRGGESQTHQCCHKWLYLLNKHPYSALFVAPSRRGLLRTYSPSRVPDLAHGVLVRVTYIGKEHVKGLTIIGHYYQESLEMSSHHLQKNIDRYCFCIIYCKNL